MNGTIISEEKLLELKDIARKIEENCKDAKALETNIIFGDRSDTTQIRLRWVCESLVEKTEKLTEIIKTL